MPYAGVYAVAPACPCGEPLVWRGGRAEWVQLDKYECDGCGRLVSLAKWRGSLPASSLPVGVTSELASSVSVFRTLQGHNSLSSSSDTGFRGLLAELELLTSPHRKRCAARLFLRGSKACMPSASVGSPGFAGAVDRLVPESEATAQDFARGSVARGLVSVTAGRASESRWHMQRMRGQAERFVRERRCGTVEHVLVGIDTTTGEYLVRLIIILLLIF